MVNNFIWLVVYLPTPLKNDESQLGWWDSQLNGNIKLMFQSTKQYQYWTFKGSCRSALSPNWLQNLDISQNKHYCVRIWHIAPLTIAKHQHIMNWPLTRLPIPVPIHTPTEYAWAKGLFFSSLLMLCFKAFLSGRESACQDSLLYSIYFTILKLAAI